MERRGNFTCCPDDQVYVSYTERQILAVIGVIISFLGIMGNTLVIAAAISSKKLHNATNMFVLNLSIADLLTCLIVVPAAVVGILSEDRWPLPAGLCKLAGFATVLCVGSSSNSLACIATSRYVLVARNRETHRRWFSRRKTVFAVVVIWLFPLGVVTIPQLTGFIELGFRPKYSICSWSSPGHPSYETNWLLFTMLYPVQFGLVSWSYAMIFRRICTHAKRVRHPSVEPAVATVMEVPNQRRDCRPERNKLQNEVTKNLFLVVCCLVVCTTPYILGLLLANTDRFLPIAAVLLFSNSCVNPFIYAAKHPHFRTVFRCIIRGKFAEIPDKISFRFCSRHF